MKLMLLMVVCFCGGVKTQIQHQKLLPKTRSRLTFGEIVSYSPIGGNFPQKNSGVPTAQRDVC